MARTLAELPAGSRITDYISLGVIARFFPRQTVDAVLERTGRASIRERDLPAHVVVYYVIALALYMRSSYREVLRCLLEGVQWLAEPSAPVRVAGNSGISQARTRWGAEPMRQLHEMVAHPIATQQTRGAWYRQWRLVSLDGSTLDVADTAANEKAFGRPGASRGASAFPKVRFVTLLENGTHVLWAAQMDQYSTDELALAEKVVPALGKDMLCLADRFFPSCKLWQMAAQTGAALLWRTRQNARLDVDQRLADGSYLSRIYASTSDRRHRRNGIVVRAVDYRLDGVPGAEPIYRLLPPNHHDPRREVSARPRVGRPLPRTVGNRDGVGRTENAFARRPNCIAQQDAGTGTPRVLRLVDGALRHSRIDARSGAASRRRPGSPFVPPLGTCCPAQDDPLRSYSPLGTRKPSPSCIRRFSPRSFKTA